MENPRASIDLTMVRTFEALLEHAKVSKAAAALGVSQPAVSQTLRKLREYFGDPLFVRDGGHLLPTPRALAVQPSIVRICGELDVIADRPRAFDPASSQRRFAVCLTDIAELLFMPAIVSSLSASAPRCSLRSVRLRSDEVKGALADGTIDLAIGTLQGADESLRQRRLGDYDFVCVTSARHALRRRPDRNVYAEGLHVVVPRVGEDSDFATAALKRLGIDRKVVLTVPNHVAAAAVVSEAGLIATLPRAVVRWLSGVFDIETSELPFRLGKVTTRMVWHERHHNDAAHRWLRQLFEKNYVVKDTGMTG